MFYNRKILKNQKVLEHIKNMSKTENPLDKKHHGISMEQPNYCTNINIKGGIGISIFAFIKQKKIWKVLEPCFCN